MSAPPRCPFRSRRCVTVVLRFRRTRDMVLAWGPCLLACLHERVRLLHGPFSMGVSEVGLALVRVLRLSMCKCLRRL